jgi:hypothetical protein
MPDEPLGKLDLPALGLQLSRQFFLRWQAQLIPRCEDQCIPRGRRVSDHGLTIIRAEHDPDRLRPTLGARLRNRLHHAALDARHGPLALEPSVRHCDWAGRTGDERSQAGKPDLR